MNTLLLLFITAIGIAYVAVMLAKSYNISFDTIKDVYGHYIVIMWYDTPIGKRDYVKLYRR